MYYPRAFKILLLLELLKSKKVYKVFISVSANIYSLVIILVADSTNASGVNTLELKSYACDTIEMKPKFDTLESIGMYGQSKSFVETDNEKPPLTGSYRGVY